MKQQAPPLLPRHVEHPQLPPHDAPPLLPPHAEFPLLSLQGQPPAKASPDKDSGTEKRGDPENGSDGEEELSNMEQLLDRIERAVHDDEAKVSLDNILDEVGRRSFGPLLLIAGIVTVMPVLGDIPGVPSVMGILVIVTAVQLLFARDHFWLPQWLLRRRVSREALCKGIGWMRKPARFLDRLLKPRIPWLVKGPGFALIAVVCLMIGLMLPPMEFVPFSANGAGLALTIFGLAIIARDGAAALLGLTIIAGTVALVTMGLM